MTFCNALLPANPALVSRQRKSGLCHGVSTFRPSNCSADHKPFLRGQSLVCGHPNETWNLKKVSPLRLQARTSTVAESPAGSLKSQPLSSKCVLVAGATGGVGQLVVAALLERGIHVRAFLRDGEKARALFGGNEYVNQLQFHLGDTRREFDSSTFEGVTHVICCTGTTAFPSKRWDGDNGPEKTDWVGVRNLVAALPSTIEKFVLVSSIGVTKYNQLPWSIMNLFGVLKYKKMSEDYLKTSRIPFTILRPARLTDGPYTSYDLNTLLKATSGTRRAVTIGQGDTVLGEASRLIVAEACVQALHLECTDGQIYELCSVEGDGPGTDSKMWEDLFRNSHRQL